MSEPPAEMYLVSVATTRDQMPCGIYDTEETAKLAARTFSRDLQGRYGDVVTGVVIEVVVRTGRTVEVE
jgi:hypothetical protein